MKSTVLLALMASVALSGPAAGQDPHATDEEGAKLVPSGFLGDYSELTPHAKKGDMLVYRKYERVLAEYDTFYIETPLVYFHPEARGVGVDPDQLAQLADFLHQEVSDRLERGGYALVDEAGPGVLRIRSAITDVDPVDPRKNVGSKVAGAAVGVGLLMPRIDLGRASIEVEMLDGASGERVAAVVATRKANRFGGVISGSKTWGDVKKAFEKWAKQFVRRLDEVRE